MSVIDLAFPKRLVYALFEWSPMTWCQGGSLTFQDHRRMSLRAQWTVRLPVAEGSVSGLETLASAKM
jgi:hypothetical protein